MRKIRELYGEHPVHLLVVTGCFALTAYVVTLVAADPSLPQILLWFVGAVVAHDLLLFPVYAAADRALPRNRSAHRVLNYVRAPTLGSVLLLLLFLPGIIEQGAATYRAATGMNQHPFLARWLLITATLFVISAACYLFRVTRHRKVRDRTKLQKRS
jgi:hypothetical protein